MRLTRVTLRRILFAIAVAAFIALAAGVLFVPSTEAVSGSCTYYNNANHTQVVGQYGYDCCNNYVAWGRKTKFSACGGCFPCTPPQP